MVKHGDASAPNAFIQWKGTNLCADIRCECGELHHVDAEFAYVVKTPCGRKYQMPETVAVTPVVYQSHADCIDPVEAT